MAANLALAALPGFTSLGDTSASARYFKQDITTPFVMENGYLIVPNTAGIGVEPDMEFLESITTHKGIISNLVQTIRKISAIRTFSDQKVWG